MKIRECFIGVGFRSAKAVAPHILNEVRGYLCVSFHILFKAEHFIGTLIGCCFSVFLRRIRLRVHGGEKLNGVKTAFVDIKMDIALFKIWCAGRPDLGFRVQSFHGKPSAIADTFAVFLRQNEKKFQLDVMCFFVDFQHYE